MNDKEFREWLEGLPPNVRRAYSWRASMRLLPLLFQVTFSTTAGSNLILAGLRMALMIGITVNGRPLVMAHANSRISDSHSVTGPSLRILRALANAAAGEFAAMVQELEVAAAIAKPLRVDVSGETIYSVTPGSKSVAAAMTQDAALKSEALCDQAISPLPQAMNEVLVYWSNGRTDILRSGAPWTFWAEWYDRAMAGDPLPWDLQEQIALIPNEIWEAGPEAVAEEIEKIRFGWRTKVVPGLVRDEDAGQFRVEDDTELPSDFLEFSKNRAEQSLVATLGSVSPNIFHAGSYEAIVLRGALDGPKTASLYAAGMYEACLGLNANIGDLYPEEIALINLKNALAGIVDELCEIDEDARKRCAKIAGYNPEVAEVLTEEELRSIPEITGPEVEPAAREIIESDVERILADEATVPRWKRIRLANWMTTISIYWDRTKKAAKEAETLAKMVGKLRVAWRIVRGGDDV